MNAFRFRGVRYVWDAAGPRRQLGRDELGRVYDRVHYRVDGGARGRDRRLADGDATLLDKGIRVYTIRGIPPKAPLAACYDGLWRLYEAESDVAAELRELRGRISSIGIADFKDPNNELAEIWDADTVSDMIDELIYAQTARARATPAKHQLVLHLDGGGLRSLPPETPAPIMFEARLEEALMSVGEEQGAGADRRVCEGRELR